MMLLVLFLCVSASTPEIQPLEVFLDGARRASVDDREAALSAVEQSEEKLAAVGKALPSLGARGVYTRNSFALTFPFAGQELALQKFNQWDAYLQFDAPLMDFATWVRAHAARRAAESAKSNAQATVLDVEKRIASSYYQLIGAFALRTSAERRLATAEQNHSLTVERRTGGIATALDVERAAAEVESAKQSIADAELIGNLARRALRTLSGIEAQGEPRAEADDLHDESPLQSWEAARDVPSLVASVQAGEAAASSALAAKLSLLPTIAATGVQRFTDTPGLLFGHKSIEVLTVTASWRFDLTTVANLRAAQAQADIADVRTERTRLAVQDAIYESWERVRQSIVKSRAAKAEVKAAELAASYAQERYEGGTGTQLEVVQALRDAFSAEGARIQADADLALARATLRLNAGRPLERSIHE